jgi:PAT family beta-lactamase induction signal transducer AmpG
MPSSSAPRMLHPAAWVPSAYFAEGIPFALVIWVAGTLFKDLGHSDGEITLATASIGIAWSLKPLWAALLDMGKTKKFFVLSMEYAIAALLVLAALVLRVPSLPHFQAIIGLFWIMAFCSSTQDICVDGVYVTALDPARQAAFIGVQGMAWNIGRIFATALLVWLAGTLKVDVGLPATSAWSTALLAAAGMMMLLGIYHGVVLPTGVPASRPENVRAAVSTFVDTLRDFVKKPQLLGMLTFVFLYRSGEGFLLVEAPLFLQSSLAAGGVGLSLKDKGLIDGTIGTTVSLIGGLLGGVFIAKRGLPRALFPMAVCMNVPHLCYLYLSQQVAPDHPLSFATIGTLVAIEKCGYSFAAVAIMLYMMQQITPGKYPMAHYAFCTALMNLVLVPTQMLSGPIAERLGYRHFFVFVLLASIPSLIAAWFAPFARDPAELSG